jgi:hypothetical protein
MTVVHPTNYLAGWSMVLAAFATGAGIGLFFHRDDFLGGYVSFRRRMVRLGHIALAALGLFNVVYGLCPRPAPATALSTWTNALWITGGIAMPLVCFLSAWRERFRNLFFIPVAALLAATVLMICSGPSS